MKIALIGYGKMGREIEKICLERGHEIVVRADIDNPASDDDLQKADAAIEFTSPDAVVNNIFQCFNVNLPVIVGTTGWMNQIEEVKKKCMDLEQSLFYASNFSIGVNVFFEINNKLAAMMNDHPDYEVSIEETHHTEKLDAPSGTAITLADGIIEQLATKTKWINSKTDDEDSLAIISHREDKTPGTHTVNYSSAIDGIEIKHEAKSRRGFAVGAVIAAEWLGNKKGIYTMKDLLNI